MCEASGRGGGYLYLDELSMHKLRGYSIRGGSPRGGHESHLISTMYIYGGSGGDVRVVGNGDVVEDVDRQVSSRTMDGD